MRLFGFHRKFTQYVPGWPGAAKSLILNCCESTFSNVEFDMSICMGAGGTSTAKDLPNDASNKKTEIIKTVLFIFSSGHSFIIMTELALSKEPPFSNDN